MGLSAEQTRWAQLNLKPGLFIGQVGEGNWRYPFVFRIPEMNPAAVNANVADPPNPVPLLNLPSVPAA